MGNENDALSSAMRAAAFGRSVNMRAEPPGNGEINDFIRGGGARSTPATDASPSHGHESSHPAVQALARAADGVLVDPSAVFRAIESDDQLDRLFVDADGEVDEPAVAAFVHEVARRVPSLAVARPGSFDGGARTTRRPKAEPSMSDRLRQAALNSSRLREGYPLGRGDDFLR